MQDLTEGHSGVFSLVNRFASRRRPGNAAARRRSARDRVQSRDSASAGSRRRWKALTRAWLNKPSRRETQSREVALLGPDRSGCRRGLHSHNRHVLIHLLTQTRFLPFAPDPRHRIPASSSGGSSGVVSSDAGTFPVSECRKAAISSAWPAARSLPSCTFAMITTASARRSTDPSWK